MPTNILDSINNKVGTFPGASAAPPAVLPPLGWLVQLPDLLSRARGVTGGGASFVYAPTPPPVPGIAILVTGGLPKLILVLPQT